MVALFADETYDSLDPISQMVEPFQCPVLDELSKLDQSFVLTRDQVRPFMIKMCKSGSFYLGLDKLIAHVMYGRNEIFEEDSTTICSAYRSMFNRSLKVDLSDGCFSYNTNKGAVVKESDILISKLDTSESKIIDYVLEKACDNIYTPSELDTEDIQRLSDLADLLDVPCERRRKGQKYWRDLICGALETKIRSNQWRIRSSEAMFDVASLVSQVASGSGSNYHLAKINLIHIKAIARSNKPIYKISRL
jgi:hypothetical protein